jgi:sugar lactone lactonase YvrE
MPSEPSALALSAGGGLVAALREGLVHFDTANGVVTPIAPAPYDTTKVRFNDGRVDPAGRFWIGTIYEPRDRQAAEMVVLERGKLRLAWSGGMTNSNGLAFSPDGQTMYHADTAAHRIDRHGFDAATGRVAPPQAFQQFAADKTDPGYGGRPDGAAVDSAGAYWCAMFEGSRLLRFAPDGTLLREVKLPLRCPTMVAFGGDDLRTLYITSAGLKRPDVERARYPLSGCVLSLRVDVAGLAEPLYQP